MKILLIEDNVQSRCLASIQLQGRGHEVVNADSGPCGLERASSLLPDPMLLDGMARHAVTRALKAAPPLQAIPVVAVGLRAMPGERERAVAARVQGCPEKPINPATFVTEVERVRRPPP